ncbi:MAG: carbohydrate ABC transporter permease, partial [Clostridiales bacterium]|nr:carbohydrate ABC transporter permease [Clostridiales bacterium]
MSNKSSKKRRTGSPMHASLGDKVFDTVNVILLSLLTLITIYPLIFVLSASLSDPLEVVTGRVYLLPRGLNIDAYKSVLGNATIGRGYRNSIFYTCLGVSLSMTLTIFAAFGLSRPNLIGRKFFTIIITLTMFFSGGLVPLYLVVRSLGLIGKFWSIILPSAMSAYNMLIMRSYFMTSIPYSLQEASIIDGCTPWKMLIKIMLPLSKPVLAVIALFYGVARWNSYFSAMLYLSSQKELWPLQLIIREIVIQSTTTEMMEVGLVSLEQIMAKEALKYTSIIVASLPLLIAYPFIQKYFVKGVMIGAIKG